jgi:uncharacterized membrane protein
MTKDKKSTKTGWRSWLNLSKAFPLILIVFGFTGLLASSAISIEKVSLLKDPTAELVCNINPIYSCGNVINSKQSSVFGFSNELMGIAMFSAIITVGVLVISGSKLNPRIWKLFMLGMVGSMAFVLWFFYQSVYVIGSLCIFCSIVWFSTWTITTALFAWAYDQKLVAIPKSLEKIIAVKRKYIITIWLVLILTLIALIIKHFWFFYGPKFGF